MSMYFDQKLSKLTYIWLLVEQGQRLDINERYLVENGSFLPEIIDILSSLAVH